MARLIRIILGPCTDALRTYLSKKIHPNTLSQEVEKSWTYYLEKRQESPINKLQTKLVYGRDYSKFDFTLLYCLFRYICPTSKQEHGWGKKTYLYFSKDWNLPEMVEEICSIRKKYIVHARDIGIPDQEFKNVWTKLVSIVKRLEGGIGSSTVYQDAVKRLKLCYMDLKV